MPELENKPESNTFPILEEFLGYMEAILGRSELTIKEYRYDLRLFFRFLKQYRGEVPKGTDLQEIPLDQINANYLRNIKLTDFYAFLSWLTRERKASAANRSRKVSALKSFFSFATAKRNYLEVDPTAELESPKIPKRQPKYLSLEESRTLLHKVDPEEDQFASRNYCIITLFLNCGLRLAELCSINVDDIQGDTLRVVGKGGKERTIYLNQACLKAIENYLPDRPKRAKDKKALFISRQGNRLARNSVQLMITKYLAKAGIDTNKYSTHKLRHTAATLMYQYGHVDIRMLQEILGHESVATTEIYTHVDKSQLHQAVESNPLASESPTDDSLTDDSPADDSPTHDSPTHDFPTHDSSAD